MSAPTTPPKQFYYQINGTIIGPMTGSELRESAFVGNVVPTTLVANDPNGEWVPANRVRGLFDERGRPLPHPPETSRLLEGRQETPQEEPTREANEEATSDRSRQSSTQIEADQTKTTTRSASDSRRNIASFVVEHADDLSNVPGVNEYVEVHDRLTKQIAEAKDRQKRLVRAKQEYEPLAQHVDKCRRDLRDAETELAKSHRPLGETAFRAFLAGEIDELPVFADRLAIHKRVQELQQECDRLSPGSDAGLVQQAKAKAQQLAIIGKIKLEELKFGGLHSKIGREIVEGELNESIRCDTTGQVLSQIKEQRDGIAKCSAELKESTTALTASGKRLSATVGLASIESSRDLAAAAKLCAKNVKQHESDLEAATRGLVDALQKVDVGSLPNSLVTLVGGLTNAGEHDFAGRAEEFKQKGIETAASAKKYWSGLEHRTKIIMSFTAISAAIVGLLCWSQASSSLKPSIHAGIGSANDSNGRHERLSEPQQDGSADNRDDPNVFSEIEFALSLENGDERTTLLSEMAVIIARMNAISESMKLADELDKPTTMICEIACAQADNDHPEDALKTAKQLPQEGREELVKVFSHVAVAYAYAGQHDDAKAAFESAARIFASSSDKDEQVRIANAILLSMAECCDIRIAVNEAVSLQDALGHGHVNVMLSDMMVQLIRQDRYEDSLIVAEQLIVGLLSSEVALVFAAKWNAEHHNYNVADKASKGVTNPGWRIEVLAEMAYHFPEHRKSLVAEAVQIAEKHRSPATLRELTTLYAGIGDLDKAHRTVERIVALNEPKMAAQALTAVAVSEIRRGRLEEGNRTMARATQIATMLPRPFARSVVRRMSRDRFSEELLRVDYDGAWDWLYGLDRLNRAYAILGMEEEFDGAKPRTRKAILKPLKWEPRLSERLSR